MRIEVDKELGPEVEELIEDGKTVLGNLQQLCHFRNDSHMLAQHAVDLGNTTERRYIFCLRQMSK